MKGKLSLLLALMLVLVVVLVCGKRAPTLTDEELYDADLMAWCDKIYHQNVVCPLQGKVEIPAEIMAQDEAEHLDWCNSIDNRNAGCPGYDATLVK